MMKDASLVWTLCYTRKQPHPWRIPAAAKFVCRLYGDTKCDSLNELRTSLSKSRERSTCKENAPNSRQFHVASTTCHVPALHLETCPHSDSQYPPQLQRGNSAAAEKPLCRMGQFWWVVGDGVSQTILCTKPCWRQKTQSIDLLHDKSTFIRKWSLCVFETLFGGLQATYAVHRRLIGKPVVDFLLVIIQLFSLGAMA